MKFFTSQINLSSILPFIETENNYYFIRNHLLTRPTTTERQIASRIAATSDERIHPQDAHDLSKLDLPRTSLSNRHLIIHYKHEARLCIYN